MLIDFGRLRVQRATRIWGKLVSGLLDLPSPATEKAAQQWVAGLAGPANHSHLGRYATSQSELATDEWVGRPLDLPQLYSLLYATPWGAKDSYPLFSLSSLSRLSPSPEPKPQRVAGLDNLTWQVAGAHGLVTQRNWRDSQHDQALQGVSPPKLIA